MPISHVEALCLKASVGTAWCGGLLELLTSQTFLGILLAAIGTGAAVGLSLRRDYREAERQAWMRREALLREALLRAQLDRSVSLEDSLAATLGVPEPEPD
jgi:hypothetical protein